MSVASPAGRQPAYWTIPHKMDARRAPIAANLGVERDDFEYAPFAQEGGYGRVHQLFGNELNKLIEELNGALAA